MKLLTFEREAQRHVGALTPEGIVDLTLALPGQADDMVQLLGAGSEGLQRAQRAIDNARTFVALKSVRLLAPVLRPSKFLGVGGNFASHIAEAAHLGAKTPPYPVWFNKQVNCVNAPYGELLRPFDSEELDYEGELGIVIGRRCRRITVEDAFSVVAGYVVCNDVSVRDWQMRAPTSTVGKSFDTHGPFGPWITTPDEAGDPGNMRIRTWVNGDLRQDGSTAEMIFGCAELIADLTQRVTLEVGDVLSVGSPAGVGGLRKPPQFLHAGDVVRVEVDGLGAIENVVRQELRA
jgi:2-keto-4-pentenoate hydratase/2-oxohepta-3-ene-1,7-dioic acid hydratase in catechol pathway